MSNVIGVMGESGSGKTTSIRNLDPKETYIIDCDKKGLSWKGWKEQYSEEKKNYVKTDFPQVVKQYLANINDKAPHIKTVIIDTINGIMVADEMRRSKEKGYDKWMDLAACIYDLVDYALTCRDDLNIIFMCHTQTEVYDSGYQFTHIKTSGKKLDKIVLESKFSTVLLAKCIDGQHIFETQSNFSTAKSPLGVFEDKVIENDLAKVIEAFKDF